MRHLEPLLAAPCLAEAPARPPWAQPCSAGPFLFGDVNDEFPLMVCEAVSASRCRA